MVFCALYVVPLRCVPYIFPAACAQTNPQTQTTNTERPPPRPWCCRLVVIPQQHNVFLAPTLCPSHRSHAAPGTGARHSRRLLGVPVLWLFPYSEYDLSTVSTALRPGLRSLRSAPIEGSRFQARLPAAAEEPGSEEVRPSAIAAAIAIAAATPLTYLVPACLKASALSVGGWLVPLAARWSSALVVLVLAAS